jgi:protein TonB
MEKYVTIVTIAVAATFASCASQVPADSMPIPRFQAQPVYPLDMRTVDYTGTAVVEFIVDKSGTVIEAHSVRADSPSFAQAAVDAVKKWKFVPGIRHGVPVNTKMTVPIKFELSPMIGPTQSPHPTSPAVTPAADAPVAPSVGGGSN